MSVEMLRCFGMDVHWGDWVEVGVSGARWVSVDVNGLW